MNVQFGTQAPQARIQAQPQAGGKAAQANSVKFGIEPISCCIAPVACCAIVPATLIGGGLLFGLYKAAKALLGKAGNAASGTGNWIKGLFNRGEAAKSQTLEAPNSGTTPSAEK